MSRSNRGGRRAGQKEGPWSRPGIHGAADSVPHCGYVLPLIEQHGRLCAQKHRRVSLGYLSLSWLIEPEDGPDAAFRRGGFSNALGPFQRDGC